MKPSTATRLNRLRELEAWYLNKLLYTARTPRLAAESAHYAQRVLTARLIRPIIANIDTEYNTKPLVSALMRHLQWCAAENQHNRAIAAL
jgi:uncharacterized HAD superfamily protein